MQSTEPVGIITNRITKFEGKLLAAEMYKGCDHLFEKHMHQVKELFNECRMIQQQRQLMLSELAQLAQLYRDL
jgi:hypothetical protein